VPRGVRVNTERRRTVWEAVPLRDAMLFLGVCRATIDRMVAAGTLHPFRTDGNHRRFKVAELRRIRERQTRRKPPKPAS